MFSWCKNRLEITAKSVCIDVMQSGLPALKLRVIDMPYGRP